MRHMGKKGGILTGDCRREHPLADPAAVRGLVPGAAAGDELHLGAVNLRAGDHLGRAERGSRFETDEEWGGRGECERESMGRGGMGGVAWEG